MTALTSTGIKVTGMRHNFQSNRNLRQLQCAVVLMVVLNASAFGFHTSDHAALTHQALIHVGSGFLQSKITEVTNANLCVDEGTFKLFGDDFDQPCVPFFSPIPLCQSCMKYPEFHFDDESFVAASIQLQTL